MSGRNLLVPVSIGGHEYIIRDMKKYILLTILTGCLQAYGQSPVPTMRSVLLDQLKSTHSTTGWFVPVSAALDGVTPEQAVWTDGSGHHSIAQLTTHLLFWNERQLKNFRGEKNDPFGGDNTRTFSVPDKNEWDHTMKSLDRVLGDLEKIVQDASESQLNEWAPVVANISAHNAYHIGQIVYIRKLQGSWDPEKGVK
jgi:hypothetical protein